MATALAPEPRPELRAFETALPQMLAQHEGQFVVMRGSSVLHWAATYEEALEWGYNSFGLDPFFVKQVRADHNTVHYTRDLGPCTR